MEEKMKKLLERIHFDTSHYDFLLDAVLVKIKLLNKGKRIVSKFISLYFKKEWFTCKCL